MPIFEFIGENHAFAGEIAMLRDHIANEPLVGRTFSRPAAKPPIVHTEIKVTRSADGAFAFDRFYWSMQLNQPGHPFVARTLVLDRRAPGPAWHTFPQDSYLPGLAAYATSADEWDVLRYVPLRRFTFRERKGGAQRIGKFKRRSRFQEAYEKLDFSSRLLSGQQGSFRVAGPAGISHEHALYYQDALEGENVAELITSATAESLLQQVGRLHRKIHAVDGKGLNLRTNAEFLKSALLDIEIISFYLPSFGERLRTLTEQLSRTKPDDTLVSFCHGDFVCSQLLMDDGKFSIVDFDLCCMADPCREIAMFMASLIYDVPQLAPPPQDGDGSWRNLIEMSKVAYLSGYELSAQHEQRLRWHRLCAELYYLALMLKKDRFEHQAADFRLAQIERIAECAG